ncbi:hypothetical protein V501_02817 [Pseudogymnoascus sp. VKM F-4519 (FW-2642)]|nr:hypothetical protein V501_02817 [Pseudogymnoascus sp. VKM F-4519 (FW-2642)]
MSPHIPPNPSSPSPTGHTTSSSSTSSTTLLTPDGASPTPGNEAPPTSLHHETISLDEATKEIVGEISQLERDYADLKSRKAELELKIEELKREMVALDAAEKRAAEECKEKRACLEEWEKKLEGLMENLKELYSHSKGAVMKTVTAALLYIPLVSLGVTVVATEVAIGWRMVSWGVAAVSR